MDNIGLAERLTRQLPGDDYYIGVFIRYAKIYKPEKNVNLEDAKDFVQNFRLKFLIKISEGRYQERGYLKTWAYEIAKNEAMDLFRKNKHSIEKDAVYIDEIATEIFSKNDDNAGCGFLDYVFITQTEDLQGYLNEFFHPKIAYAIELLPEKYRETFILRNFYELDYKDIAEQMQIPMGTVKNRLFRASEMIRRTLGVNSSAEFSAKY